MTQVLVSPLTKWTAAFVAGGRQVVTPSVEKVVGSCEAVNSAGQWVATLVVVLFHVTNEVKLRRAFLRQEATRYPGHQAQFLKWPLGNVKGLTAVVVAYLTPLVTFALLWHVWLLLMQWVISAWEGEAHFAAILRLPYAFL
jgi:hypothetical protein